MKKTGCVIPVGEGREENLRRTLEAVASASVVPARVVLVFDGASVGPYLPVIAAVESSLRLTVIELEKHRPGMVQPRNVGVKELAATERIDYVWFLDTDCAPEPGCLMAFEWAMLQAGDRILVGRYDWLAEGAEEPQDGVELDDPRAASFAQFSALKVFRGDLSAGLACFSGNLVWPVLGFQRVGGFWSEIHHGRCEDGELGLRAVSMGLPISYCGIAVAHHHWHPRNVALAMERNERDVPMLNERHPWVESRCSCGHQKTLHLSGAAMGDHGGACKDCACEEFEQAMFVVDRDGKRFDARCSIPGCDWSGNTAGIWAHEATHPLG
jgi:GT2 family glycosyltransferase